MRFLLPGTIFMLLVGAASALAAPPPAVPPAGPLPLSARMHLLLDYENLLSQAMGHEISITSLHIYNEQDGGTTMCIKGLAEGRRFRLVEKKVDVLGDPSEAKWIEAGCTRPGYQLIH
jgi:hypothetical protein